jgi:outer membrane protein TolC
LRPLSFVVLALFISNGLGQSTNTHPIDLPTALKLAGANNVDVQIARERVNQARADHNAVVAQFFPWLSAGITYRRHDDKLQDVEGNILDVHKYSYAPGATIAAQVDVGDTWYKSLATKQLAHAAGHALESQRQDTVFAAAQGYYELALAQAAVDIATQSLQISTNYYEQLKHAVGAGIAFKGDELRVLVQSERSQLSLRQALEQQRNASARLAQVLRLDPAIELIAPNTDLLPVALIETNVALSPLVQQALNSRPELKENRAVIASARDVRNGVTYGPLIPTLGAQAFFGGLGGGRRGVSDSFGAQEDYLVGLSWRVGPGGLLDYTRVEAADARRKLAELSGEKLQDEIIRQVVETFTRWQSLSDQVEIARRVLAAAEESLRLAQQRKQFAVGIVLENIQAEQDLTRARLEYVRAVAEFNKMQYALRKVTGQL